MPHLSDGRPIFRPESGVLPPASRQGPLQPRIYSGDECRSFERPKQRAGQPDADGMVVGEVVELKRGYQGASAPCTWMCVYLLASLNFELPLCSSLHRILLPAVCNIRGDPAAGRAATLFYRPERISYTTADLSSVGEHPCTRVVSRRTVRPFT